MSAFLCSDLHIYTIAYYKNDSDFNACPNTRYGLSDRAEFATDMLELNWKSLEARYGDQEIFDRVLHFQNFLNHPIPKKPTLTEFVKHCDCFLYQSCEIEEYGNHSIYIAVERIRLQALRTFIKIDYETAPWGI